MSKVEGRFMGRSLANHFKKRFGDRKFVVIYPEKPLEGADRRIHNEKIFQAITSVLADILKREPTADELSGLEDISKTKVS
jgi:hypothetical protein